MFNLKTLHEPTDMDHPLAKYRLTIVSNVLAQLKALEESGQRLTGPEFETKFNELVEIEKSKLGLPKD